MLINVSRKVSVMLMSRTSRMAVEVLVELVGQGSHEWMKAEELYLGIDSGIPFLKEVLNRLTRAGFARAGQGGVPGISLHDVRRRCS